ncbi:MAG: sialidase family protein [Planctomycetota bacterium]|nr:sialidase family protein [Planctomycetota bacterium]
MQDSTISAQHGVICSMPEDRMGYFGWPSVARLDDGTLMVASSGLRTEHVCPWGKTVLLTSKDDGQSWSGPEILNDTPLDDRDAGVVNLGGERLLVSWFTSDTRKHYERRKESMNEDEKRLWEEKLSEWSDELVGKWLGSWVRLREDGGHWSEPIKVPVSTPHGPIVLDNGDLLYFGKNSSDGMVPGAIQACRSNDGGRNWIALGEVPIPGDTVNSNFHEPHVVELPGGKLIGHIRYEHAGDSRTYDELCTFQSESTDGGKTWSEARHLRYGSPPHLLRHSSGALVCVFGFRREPYGQRAMVSTDGGESWGPDIILIGDAPSWDLGYPASVEMPGGRIFTIYYQQQALGQKCSLLWTSWELP